MTLSVKDLVKIYKTKGGVEVRALDGVSIDFPETGMVFLLGRSGSGKSTLLNVVGGLDTPTDGELIVNGKSSAEFSVSDFDSYRNTFVGFVFQEYNILEEFTVEQNIALALQLQNKVAEKEAIRDILEKVDLRDVEKRKPSTLSGGQRQRIAIARALIKSPKIIMADEP
ncbi:MAG: ATP-binding cassette domain-containing protein, partial [Clostridia bacterium]|nr:ATP-binding cassette domain-containing protein [Clostridia bacterium]